MEIFLPQLLVRFVVVVSNYLRCEDNFFWLISFLPRCSSNNTKDGANVGYHGYSQVHYSSVKKLVEKLLSMGERPLVVMPEKYTQNAFNVGINIGGRALVQKLTEKDREVIEW